MKGEIMLCRCCDKPVEGTAFCRTCYDRANYQPDSGEINTDLLEACKVLVEYRQKAGPLGFQLEKADYYIEQIEAAIAKTEG